MRTNEKYPKLGKRGGEVATFIYFRIFGPLYISGTVEARNFKHVYKRLQIE